MVPSDQLNCYNLLMLSVTHRSTEENTNSEDTKNTGAGSWERCCFKDNTCWSGWNQEIQRAKMAT